MKINMENVKEFVEQRLVSAEIFANTYEQAMNYRAVAYGAVMFAQEMGIVTYEEVKEYWDNNIWEKFENIAKEKGKGPKVEVI
jgi:hypothetical protein